MILTFKKPVTETLDYAIYLTLKRHRREPCSLWYGSSASWRCANPCLYACRYFMAPSAGMLPRDIHEIGAEIILGNTFHLWLRPTTDVIDKFGGLHDFIGWNKRF